MAQDVLEFQADRLLEQAGRYDLTSRAIRRQERLWRRRTVDLDGLAVAAQVTEGATDPDAAAEAIALAMSEVADAPAEEILGSVRFE